MSSDNEYFRDCKFCGKSIKMSKSKETGKWAGYDVSGEQHRCNKQGWKGPSKTTDAVHTATKQTSYANRPLATDAELDQIVDDIDRIHKILANLQERIEEKLR